MPGIWTREIVLNDRRGIWRLGDQTKVIIETLPFRPPIVFLPVKQAGGQVSAGFVGVVSTVKPAQFSFLPNLRRTFATLATHQCDPDSYKDEQELW